MNKENLTYTNNITGVAFHVWATTPPRTIHRKAAFPSGSVAFFMSNKFYDNTGSFNNCLSVVYMPIQRNKSAIVNPLHINNEILALQQ